MPQNQAAYFDQIRKETMSPVPAVSRYRALGIRTGVFRSTIPCLQRGREEDLRRPVCRRKAAPAFTL